MSYIAEQAEISSLVADLEDHIHNNTLSGIREQALKAFRAQGLPHRKSEEYKYTPVTKALEKEFESITGQSPVPAEDTVIGEFVPKDLDGNVLVFVNGHYRADYSKIISPEDEIIIREYDKAAAEQPGELAQYLAAFEDSEEDPFASLNMVLSRGGTFIKVADNKVIEKPVVLYFIADTHADKATAHPRNLFVAGKNSQVNLVESFYSAGENASFTNILSEILLQEDAFVNYHKIQLESSHAFHVGNTRVHQAGKSVFNGITVTLSGKMVRNNLDISLDTEYCETHMYGLYLLDGNQHVDNHTTVDHRKAHCESNELYKGILDDKATGVFNGKIFVRPGAQKTNAFQSNKNILLSDDATVNTKPQLEIWADDVKCSHGATTGQIDEDQLFYLRARGLSEDNARAMLLYAFSQDVLENIKVASIKTYLESIISARLHSDF